MGTDAHNSRDIGIRAAKLACLQEEVDTPGRQEGTSWKFPKWPTLAGRLCQLRQE
jgi:hypothetical protein